MKISRKEQIFKVCASLKEDGFNSADQYTLQAVADKCQSFGFAIGNKLYVRKYRDEWLEKFLPESNETFPVVSESAHIQFSLDSLLNEHKQKIEQELKDKYKAAFEQLSEEKRQAELKSEDTQIELDDMVGLLQHSRNETLEANKQISELTRTNNSLSEKIGGISADNDVLREEVETIRYEYESRISSMQKSSNVIKAEKDSRIKQLETANNELKSIHSCQLEDLKTYHKQMFDEYKEQGEHFRHSVIKREDEITTELKRLREEVIELKKSESSLATQLESKDKVNQILEEQFNVVLDELKDVKKIKPAVEKLLNDNKDHYSSSLAELMNNLKAQKKDKSKGVA